MSDRLREVLRLGALERQRSAHVGVDMNSLPQELQQLILKALDGSQDLCQSLFYYARTSNARRQQVMEMLTTDGDKVMAGLLNFREASYFNTGMGLDSFDMAVAFHRNSLLEQRSVSSVLFIQDVEDLYLEGHYTRWSNGELYRYNNNLLRDLAIRWKESYRHPHYLLDAPAHVPVDARPAFYRSLIRCTCADVSFSRALVLVGYLLEIHDNELRSHFRFHAQSDHLRGRQVGDFSADSSDAGILNDSRITMQSAIQLLKDVEPMVSYYVVATVNAGDAGAIEIYRPNGSVNVAFFKHVCTASFEQNVDYYLKNVPELRNMSGTLRDQFTTHGRAAAFRIILDLMHTACKSATMRHAALRQNWSKFLALGLS